MHHDVHHPVALRDANNASPHMRHQISLLYAPWNTSPSCFDRYLATAMQPSSTSHPTLRHSRLLMPPSNSTPSWHPSCQT
ncbi:hypothetical protein GY45DRAFT_1322401 [Cubamyces sp. BRFM 1775]|nr:hypothetical protein GY45DRAFT_1322401 [Cubamyces sp. BRFM 1775]